MISKRKIKQRTFKKTNKELVETILLAKKNNLLELAKILSVPTKKQRRFNLLDLNKSESKEILVPGKVLSLGELTSAKKIYALGFSEKAKEKLLKSKSEFKSILEAIKENPKLNMELIK